MPFTPKVWESEPNPTGAPTGGAPTPLNATALIDLETRLAAYTDAQALLRGPRGNVYIPENYGCKGDVVYFTDGAIAAGSTTLTSASFTAGSLPAGANTKNVYVDWAGAGTALGTSSGALVTTGATTTIPRTAGAAIGIGPIIISSGAHAMVFEVQASAAAGAPITVLSATANFAYPIGSTISSMNTGLSTTVSSVASGSATLAAAATQSVQNVVGWFGTDDSVGARNMYAALAANGGTVLWGPGGYMLDSAPITTSRGNSVLPLPQTNLNVVSVILGTLGGISPLGTLAPASAPPLSGTTFYTTRQTDTYSATYGAPSMMGGPTYEGMATAGWPATSVYTTAGHLHIEGLQFIKPQNPAIGSLDCSGVTRINGISIFSKTTGYLSKLQGLTSGNGYGYTGQVPVHNWSFGIWGCNGGLTTYNWSVVKSEVYGELASFVCGLGGRFIDCFAQQSVGSFCWNDTNWGAAGPTRLDVGVFDCIHHVSGWDAVNGIKSLPTNGTNYPVIDIIDCSEQLPIVSQWGTAEHVLDANSMFRGRFRLYGLGNLSTPQIVGATGMYFDNVNATSQATTTTANVQVFTSNGTWTKPPGCTRVRVDIIAGGGGGGNGSVQLNGGTPSVGGSAGQGGGYSSVQFDASLITATVAITVGGGGSGVAGISTANTAGTNGKIGGNSGFGGYINAFGGGTSAGSTSAGTGAVGGAAGAPDVNGGDGGSGGTSMTGGSGAGGGVTSLAVGGGGGGGGRGGGGAVAGAAFGATGNGAAGSATPNLSLPIGGGGGGGGGGNPSANGGNGAAGGKYGAGGGGGGATLNGFTSGSGAAGQPGIVVVTSW